MKLAQWTAVLVLALMVGGLTFLKVYLGGGGRESSDLVSPQELPTLTFPSKVAPPESEPPLVSEVRQYGHLEFWFVNESGQALDVGLNSKGCACSEVEIALASESRKAHSLHQMAVTQAINMQLHGLVGLTMLVARNARDPLLPELPESDGALTLTKENKFTVPADAVGCVRLSWRQRSAMRKLNTYADLWIGRQGGPVNARLDARVQVAEPVVLAVREVALPTVSTRELENLAKQNTGERGWIICGSLTRKQIQVQAELIGDSIKPESDPFEVGAPTPIDDADLRRLAEEYGEQMPKILSGLKVPLTLRAYAKDGTPVQWGHFTRTVRMTAGEGAEPQLVQVTGQVLGDVSVGEVGKVRGALDLGPFSRKRGTHGTILLETDAKKLQLELDTPRIPDYLKATLSAPEETMAGHRLWKLRVEVPRNAAQGEFPRADPRYRDSAVYLKTKEKPPQSIRVPIMGMANDSDY